MERVLHIDEHLLQSLLILDENLSTRLILLWLNLTAITNFIKFLQLFSNFLYLSYQMKSFKLICFVWLLLIIIFHLFKLPYLNLMPLNLFYCQIRSALNQCFKGFALIQNHLQTVRFQQLLSIYLYLGQSYLKIVPQKLITYSSNLHYFLMRISYFHLINLV